VRDGLALRSVEAIQDALDRHAELTILHGGTAGGWTD
jgi:hypothetical protein